MLFQCTNICTIVPTVLERTFLFRLERTLQGEKSRLLGCGCGMERTGTFIPKAFSRAPHAEPQQQARGPSMRLI
jgi:hypothetical protein